MEKMADFLTGDPAVGFRELLAARVRLQQGNPEIARMWAWMTLQGGTEIPCDKVEGVRAVLRRVAEKRDEIGIPAGVDPVLYMGAIISMIDGWFLFRESLAMFAERDVEDEETMDELIRLIHATLDRPVKPENQTISEPGSTS
ncbi:MAG: hypothetical protein MH204_09880, partial [Fimbriimonadaceae bacterium]|nr:hypothetical protein [Fimbriimonadaceae bacterium]